MRTTRAHSPSGDYAPPKFRRASDAQASVKRWHTYGGLIKVTQALPRREQ